MRKKGARITHRAKTAPTMIAQAIKPNYEIRLLSATEKEQDALHLLADTSIDYWSRRSGALYVESVRQLELARKKMEKAA